MCPPELAARGRGASTQACPDARPRVRVCDVPGALGWSRPDPRPDADPRLLTRAVLGVHDSVWHWYRSGGTLTLQEVSEFFVPAASPCSASRLGSLDQVRSGPASGTAASPGARSPCGEPRPVRRRSGGCERRRTAPRGESPWRRPPCAWIARSITHVATSGEATLIAETSIHAPRLPTVSISQGALQRQQPDLLDPHSRFRVQRWTTPCWMIGLRSSPSETVRSHVIFSARSAMPIARMAWSIAPRPDALLRDPEPVPFRAERV